METPSRTVLIVDDDGDVRQRMQPILRGRGYTVLTAENADTAWCLLRRTSIDLLLVDLSMPRAQELLDGKLADPRLADIPTLVVTIGADEMAGSAGMGVAYAPAP